MQNGKNGMCQGDGGINTDLIFNPADEYFQRGVMKCRIKPLSD